MSEDYPEAGYIIASVGVIIGVVSDIASIILLNSGSLPSIGALPLLWDQLMMCLISDFILTALMIVGVELMRSPGKPDKIRTGSIITLVFSAITLNIFGIIGGVLGLIWKPSHPTAMQPAPPSLSGAQSIETQSQQTSGAPSPHLTEPQPPQTSSQVVSGPQQQPPSAIGLVACPSCGTPSPTTATFCWKCGARIR